MRYEDKSRTIQQVVIQNVDEFPGVFNKFTESNLESYQIQNAERLTCTTRKNKYRVDAVVEERDSDVLITIETMGAAH